MLILQFQLEITSYKKRHVSVEEFSQMWDNIVGTIHFNTTAFDMFSE